MSEWTFGYWCVASKSWRPWHSWNGPLYLPEDKARAKAEDFQRTNSLGTWRHWERDAPPPVLDDPGGSQEASPPATQGSLF